MDHVLSDAAFARQKDSQSLNVVFLLDVTGEPSLQLRETQRAMQEAFEAECAKLRSLPSWEELCSPGYWFRNQTALTIRRRLAGAPRS